MICRNCGNTTDDGILFCPYCGKKIEEIIDLEKKTAAVNDVFASSETTDPQVVPPVAPAPAYTEEPRPNVPPVAPAPRPAPTGTVMPPPAFGRAPVQNAEPVPPVTPVPAFNSEPVSDLRPTHAAPVPPVQPLKPAAPVPPLSQIQPAKPASGKKKEFFGTGAFVLCLVIIGLLSASTGIFAYLYFSLLGVL